MSNNSVLVPKNNYLHLSASIVFPVLSVVGNSLIIYVLTKPLFRKETFFRYLTVASIFDILSVLCIWLAYFPDFFLINKVDIMCKLYGFLPNLINEYSTWIIVLSSIDRLLAVRYPLKFDFRKEFKYQALIMLILFILLVLINLPYWFFLLIQPEYGLCLTVFDLSIYTYLNVSVAVYQVFLPFGLMVIINSITVYTLMRSQVERTTTNGIKSKKFAKQKKLLRTLIGMNLLFLFTNFPSRILYFMNEYKVSTEVIDSLYLLRFVYFSFDFFVIFFSNYLFRKYCLSIFVCKDYDKSQASGFTNTTRVTNTVNN